MFEATFVGHQGWLIEASGSRVLVDPLLCESFDHAAVTAVEVYPPRLVDIASFPPIDAVIFTHEHPDHFNIPSLLRLDREIAVLISDRTSLAAREFLREVGFRVTLLRSGNAVSVGELEIHPFHATEITRDEWDVTPLLIRDRQGHGSFATSIDAPEALSFTNFVVERTGRPGLWVSSHNHMDLFPLREDTRQEHAERTVAHLGNAFIRGFQQHFRNHPSPEVLALLEGGFAFRGPFAWMNRHVFPGRINRVAENVAATLTNTKVRTPVPGNRFVFSSGLLVEETPGQSYLRAAEPSAWPSRGAEPFDGPLPDFDPGCGYRDFSPDDLEILLHELRAFATFLYGGALHRSLYTSQRSPGGTVGFSLRTPSEKIGVAYFPEACGFSQVSPSTLSAGMECWATDLLATLRFEMLAGHLLFGRYRKWNTTDPQIPCHFELDLSLYTHPLRHPDKTLQLYRTAVRSLDVAPQPRIRHSGTRC